MASAVSEKPFSVRHLPGFSAVAITCFVILYLPIMVLVVYSFNSGANIALFEGLSWRWYEAAWQNEQVQQATIRSLILAVTASACSTVLATMAALGTTRTRNYKGITAIYAIV